MGEWKPRTLQELIRYLDKRLPKLVRTAVGAVNAADEAQVTADGAQEAAEGAQGTAAAATAAAADAAAAAGAAQTAASGAQSTANGAVSAAAAAQGAADAAKTSAQSAQSAADAAKGAADAAKSTADGAASAAATAAGIAGGKADVLIQSTAPAAEFRKATTLWIDTTNGGNTPKRWSTGTTWVAVTDKAATDAAAAAAAAQTAAGNAQSTANGAASAAAAAQTSANTAQSAATAAQSTADAAQTKANQAATAAGAAQTAANGAQSTADQAITNAGNAKTAADNAASAAATAAGIAGGKADVLIQSTAPAAEFRKATTLWIDTTNGGNTPKRWSTGTTWVAVTDKAATDAAAAAATAQTAANAAQGTANQAVSDAAAAKAAADQAAQTAVAAQTAASNAQTSANGKNTVKFRSAAPTTSAADKGTADGDLWFVIPNVQTGIVTGQFTWMAATQAWVQQTLSSAVLASIDAGKITTGTLVGITITGVTITGATVTGGVVQTASTGKRVVLANNRVNFYGTDGTTDVNAGVIEGIPNGAAGGLINVASATGGASFAQFGTRALPTAGSVGMYADTAWLDSLNVRYLFNVNTGRGIDINDTGKQYPALAAGTNDADDPLWVRRRYGLVTFGGKVSPTAQNQLIVNALNATYRPPAGFNCWLDRDGTANPEQWRITIGSSGAIRLVGPAGNAGSTSGALHFTGVPPYNAVDV